MLAISDGLAAIWLEEQAESCLAALKAAFRTLMAAAAYTRGLISFTSSQPSQPVIVSSRSNKAFSLMMTCDLRDLRPPRT